MILSGNLNFLTYRLKPLLRSCFAAIIHPCTRKNPGGLIPHTLHGRHQGRTITLVLFFAQGGFP